MYPIKTFIHERDKKRIVNLCFLFSIIIYFLTYSSKIFAQGNLLVTPKRIVFDGTKRSDELNIANVGKDSATYIISIIQLRMKDDGSIENISQPDSGQNFADKNLRVFPRKVTLAPNEAQTVKLQVIRTNELNPGEYRSHLYFRAVPNEKPLGEKQVKKDSSISVKLVPIFGISLPVIIRQGESTAMVEISEAKVIIKDAEPILKITLNRSGNMSFYGDVSVDHILNGKTTRVAGVKGLAIYAPNIIRTFVLLLDKKTGINYQTGKLRIMYLSDAPKPLILAQKEINLN